MAGILAFNLFNLGSKQTHSRISSLQIEFLAPKEQRDGTYTNVQPLSIVNFGSKISIWSAEQLKYILLEMTILQ